MDNQYLPHVVVIVFPRVRPKGRVSTVAEEHSSIQASDAGETGHTSGWNLGSLQLPKHLYGHDLTPSS